MGFAKRVRLSEFKGISEPRSSITLNDGDEIVAAMFTIENTEKDIIIYTNKGYGIRIPLDSVKLLGRAAKGTRQLVLSENEWVVNASKIDPTKKTLFYITSLGKAKLTQEKYFPICNKKDELVPLISLSPTETLLYIASVNRKKDVVRVYFRDNDPTDIELNKMEMSVRKASGKKMVRVPRGDKILSVKVFTETN
jgi:DNA gyrase subunit A